MTWLPAQALDSDIPLDRIAKDVSQHFPSICLRQYAYWKIRTDPVYPAVWEHLTSARSLPLTDLGCGPGVLGFYLRARGYDASVQGVDLDQKKIAVAREVATRYSGTFRHDVGDVRDALPYAPGHVAILDVLLYLDRREQAALFQRAASALAPRGLLILRSAIQTPGWRFNVSRVCDRLAHTIRWMLTLPVHYPDEAFLRSALEKAGLHIVQFRPLWGKTPFNTYLLIARREANDA